MSHVVLSRRIRPRQTAEKACDAPEEAFFGPAPDRGQLVRGSLGSSPKDSTGGMPDRREGPRRNFTLIFMTRGEGFIEYL